MWKKLVAQRTSELDQRAEQIFALERLEASHLVIAAAQYTTRL
jgi:hypothetical protein